MPVPNTFANATTSIPLSQLDANFATPITLGNTAIQLGNTVTTLNNMTLANVTVNSGNLTTSTVTVGAGSNTAPSITFSGDTNTGIYSPAADTIAFTEGGVEAMRIDASGQVGIGTSSPLQRLNVGSATGVNIIRVDGGNSANNEGSAIFFAQGGATRVAIGNRSAVLGGAFSTDALYYSETSTVFMAGGFTERMRIDTAGNVGIGMSSPAVRLDVVGAGGGGTQLLVSDGANQGRIQFSKAANDYAIAAGPDYGGVLFFSNGATERMRIDASGNVGIGTSLPTFRLVAANSSTDGGWLYSSGAVSILGLGGYGGATDGAFSLRYDRAAGATTFNGGSRDTPVERMRIDNVGNVGIGTSSPNSTLHVAGGSGSTIRNTASAGSSWFVGSNVDSYILHNESATPMLFTTAGVERARITSGGQLLIGTTSTTQGFVNVNGSVVYSVPVNFSGATGSLGWSTGFTPQPINVSLYGSHSVVGNNVYSLSDIRLKEGVQTLPAGAGLEFVAAADPVSFTWKTDGTADTGFIAQSLLAKGYGHLVSSVPDGAMEELQHEDGNVSPAGSRFVVRYDSIIPLLTSALKEQQAQIEALKARVAALENK